MTQQSTKADPQRLVGWLAVVGALLAWIMAVLVGAAANFNPDVLAHPAAMLDYSPQSQNLYRLSMWADILGWYVPFLAVGGFLWQRIRQSAGVLADIGLAGLIVYAVLGIVGAGMLNLTLVALTNLVVENPANGASCEAIWVTLQAAAQGIWNAEAPVFLLWGLVAAHFLRKEKWGYGRLLTLDVALFAIEFIFNLCGLADLGETMLMITLLVHPLWLFLFGITLLRKRIPVMVSADISPAG